MKGSTANDGGWAPQFRRSGKVRYVADDLNAIEKPIHFLVVDLPQSDAIFVKASATGLRSEFDPLHEVGPLPQDLR